MVETGGLENRCTGNRTGGSNPSPSAIDLPDLQRLPLSTTSLPFSIPQIWGTTGEHLESFRFEVPFPQISRTVAFNSSDGVMHGLLVRNGTCTSIDFPGATSTYANSENPEGTIVGRYTSPDGKTHGYLLTGMI